MRQLLAVLVTASALNAQELSPKEVADFLSRLSESRIGAAMQANFREERRLAPRVLREVRNKLATGLKNPKSRER